MHAAPTVESSIVTDQEHSIYLPWIICFFGSLFFFYEFIQMNMPNAISNSMMKEFGMTTTEFTSMASTYFWANVLFLIPAGQILDRYSTRRVILISLAVCVFGTYMFSQAQSVSAAAFYRFLTGIGSGFCFLSNVRLATRWFPPRKLALVTGLIVTMAMMGGIVAQNPLIRLVNLLGWREAIEINAAFGVLIFALIALFVRDFPSTQKAVQEQQREHLNTIGFWKAMSIALLTPRNWFCGAYTCFMNLPLIILGGGLGVKYLQYTAGLENTQAAWVMTAMFLGAVIGSPFMGWLSDFIELRRPPMLVGAIASILLMVALIALPIHSIPLLVVMFWLLGFITSTQVISYPTVAENSPPYLTASCVSVVSLTTIGGLGVFLPVFGSLIDWHRGGALVHGQAAYSASDFHFAMWLFPICFVISLLAAYFVPETRAKNEFI